MGVNIIKNGKNTTKKKQRYKCKSCSRKFVTDGMRFRIINDQKATVKRLLAERLSLRGISRAMEISFSWLYQFVTNLYRHLPEDLNFEVPKNQQQSSQIELSNYELD